MVRLWTAVGVGLVLCGVVLSVDLALAFPELRGSCSDVAYVGEGSPGGFEFYGFDLLVMEYSPDGGVNRCSTPFVTFALGLVGVGGAMLAAERGTW